MNVRTHTPVMVNEVLQGLNVQPEGCYVDGTFGRGGHARHVLNALGPEGRLWACDRDPEAAAEAAQWHDARFTFEQASFAELGERVKRAGHAGKVRGLYLDLGVSSPQLDNPERGFSFQHDGPLDMRMDPSSGESVAAWLARASEDSIINVLRTYGEERFARRIARRIVERRSDRPFATTADLATTIADAMPVHERHKHPATRSFLAFRVFINQELQAIERCLASVLELLAEGGRLVVLTFHSIEDRLVKRFIQANSAGNERLQYPDYYGAQTPSCPTLKRIGRGEKASAHEVDVNPRARSAICRVAEKWVAA